MSKADARKTLNDDERAMLDEQEFIEAKKKMYNRN